MSKRPEIESLIRQVARRHDGFLARRIGIRGVLSASAILIVASLFWVLRGHAVPGVVPLAWAAGCLATGVVYWIFKRMPDNAAAREADRFFDLKDGIASARHLAKHAPHDPTTALQWAWLMPRLANCRVGEISEKFPARPAAFAALLAVAAVWMSLLPASPAVRAAEQLAAETRERVEESKNELADLIDELDKETHAPEEKEALKLDEFRKLVKSIDDTGDRAEAARQFARVEQKIRDASRALDQQRDEETLKLAAAELAKAEETEARQLGKKLDHKELKEAAEMLEKLALKKFDPKDLKNPATKAKTLSEAKQELAKMRAASKRLAAAGKQRQGARHANGQHGANSKGADGQMGERSGEQGKPLEDLLAELDDAAATAERELEECELDPNSEHDDGAQNRANEMLGKLGKHTRGMHGKRMAKSKLDALRQGLAKAQSFSQGQSQMLGLAQSGSGKQAGTGSSWSERKERDDSQKNGALTQLQGQHGSGPSLSTIEESETGTGVSNRRSVAQQRDLTRQVESFVQRDDVPESLKLGVRNYFENLQSAKPAE